MRIIYKFGLLAAVSCLAVLSANAQTSTNDTILNRQVSVQRDYNPTIQDASKINTTPTIYDPLIAPKDLRFMYNAPRLKVNDTRLGNSKTGEIGTDVEYDKRKGYFLADVGNYINLNAAAGYRALNTATDKLNIFAAYNSTDGKIDYIEKGFQGKKSKAKYAEARVNLDYDHKFTPSILNIGASFQNTGFNYYGNPFLNTPLPSRLLMDKKQNVSIFNFGAGLRSNEEYGSNVKYNASLSYTAFKEKYGPSVNDKGPKGGQIKFDADFKAHFQNDKNVGIKAYLLNQSMDAAENSINPNEAGHSLTNLYAVPYFSFEDASWNALLGVKASYIMDYKNSFSVAPELSASVNIMDENSLYANVTGGINENTFLQVFQENRYVNPMNRIGYSKTLYDMNIGFKLGALDAFELEAFVGYKQVNKDHLYVTSTYDPTQYSWGNLSNVVYANIGTGNFGAQVKTKLIPYTTLYARVIGYNYNVKYKGGYLSSIESIPTEKKAWGRPTYTTEINADIVDVIPNFTLSMNYLLVGGRKAYFGGRSVSMKDINELCFKTEYRAFDWLSINVRVNNILFQKYEEVYGYSLQGFNGSAGFSLKF